MSDKKTKRYKFINARFYTPDQPGIGWCFPKPQRYWGRKSMPFAIRFWLQWGNKGFSFAMHPEVITDLFKGENK